MKPFKARFKVEYRNCVISYSARKMALRVGFVNYVITKDDLTALENCSPYKIDIPMGIFERIFCSTRDNK